MSADSRAAISAVRGDEEVSGSAYPVWDAGKTMRPKCEVRGLLKRFGSHVAVDDISFSVDQGEFVVLLGPSGCGKTTTLRLIAGLEKPDTGTIALNGSIVSDPTRHLFVPPERRDIGMVFQSYAIWPHMTVFENVGYPLRVRRLSHADVREKVTRVLDLVGLAGQATRSATALSGGQMQRVALARALVFDPTLLLFDEPLSNLDLKLREGLRLELKELQRRTGLTSIYVTHDQDEAVELADRIIIMDHGRIVQIGAPLDMYIRPKTRFVAEFISAANIFEATVLGVLDGGLCRLGIDGGNELNAIREESVSIGDRVDVVIHPEDCTLTAPHAATTGHKVRIAHRQFQGTATRYTVDWAGLPFCVVALGTRDLIGEGADAVLHLPVESTRILPRRVS
jgi:ABC-type Fe3+/spermidine/putrescine transport system ATPase subunit